MQTCSNDTTKTRKSQRQDWRKLVGKVGDARSPIRFPGWNVPVIGDRKRHITCGRKAIQSKSAGVTYQADCGTTKCGWCRGRKVASLKRRVLYEDSKHPLHIVVIPDDEYKTWTRKAQRKNAPYFPFCTDGERWVVTSLGTPRYPLPEPDDLGEWIEDLLIDRPYGSRNRGSKYFGESGPPHQNEDGDWTLLDITWDEFLAEKRARAAAKKANEDRRVDAAQTIGVYHE